MITEEQLTQLGFVEVRKYNSSLTRWENIKFPKLGFDYKKDIGTLIAYFGGSLLDITEVSNLEKMITLEKEWLHKLRRKET